jgi:hypothetical protein
MTTNRHVALVLMKSPEGEATVEALAGQPGVEVLDYDTYWKIVADREIRVRMRDVAELLARPLDISQWLVIMTTYVGRAMVDDGDFVVSSDMRYLEAPTAPEGVKVVAG